MKKPSFFVAVAAVATAMLSGSAMADLSFTPSNNADALVQALLSDTAGITLVANSAVLVVPSTGTPAGTFTGGNGILPFAEGVVLSSGNIATLVGPNSSSSAGNPLGDPDDGDADLDAIAGSDTQDAATLSFSFIPVNNTISFQFVFGSEEYNEFVGSLFNDVFAFFLNGENIALLPGTNTVISINSVNNGNTEEPPPVPPSNPSYFFDNNSDGRNIELDGLVGVNNGFQLFATGSVTPGEVNTIKLAIADVSDDIFDSAVFIKSGSFDDAPPPDQNPNPNPVVPLPLGAWMALGTLGGLGAVKKLRTRTGC